VRYDGPAYRSAGAYPATRVVFAKPNQIEPQFIFTERVAGSPFVSVREERPAQKTAGPANEAGASARDVGGIGSVPAPLGRREAVHEDGLRRLIRSRSSSDVSLMSRTGGLNAATRPQPRLIRRSKTKPDTSGTRRKSKPDTSGSGSGWNSPGS
jgi:hypothetical protein